ncbi:MAG: hypothetical protein C0594_10845, partial [Marinilabiliales bacterium]
ISGNNYGFSLGKYNPDYELVIDPLLAATYFGEPYSDNFIDFIFDEDGNMIVLSTCESISGTPCDITESSNITDILDSGLTALHNKWIMVSKFTPDLAELLSCTYIGSYSDWQYPKPVSILQISNGNIVIAGETNSDTYPVTDDAQDQTYNGGYDIFYSTLNPDLDELVYSSYYGSSGNEHLVKAERSLYGFHMVGYTSSTTLPETTGLYSESNSGGNDIFVAYTYFSNYIAGATFIGGSSNDTPTDFMYDNTLSLVITGTTSSSNFPTTSGVYQEVNNGGDDVFILKLYNNLTDVPTSTMFGTENNETGSKITKKKDNSAYIILGKCESDLSVSGNAMINTYDANNSIFLGVMSTDLSTVDYLSYIYGNKYYSCNIARNSLDELYVSTNYRYEFPLFDNSFDSVSYENNIYVYRLNNEYNSVISATTIGDDFSITPTDILISGDTAIYFGTTRTSNMPITGHGYDESYNGSSDVYICALDSALSEQAMEIISPIDDDTICLGSNLQLILNVLGAESYQWYVDEGNGFTDDPDYLNYNLTFPSINSQINDSLFSGSQLYCVAYNGTDSVVSDTITITVLGYHLRFYHDICNGDSIYLEGEYLSEAGNEVFSYTSMNGCDSVVQHYIYIKPEYSYDLYDTICSYDTLIWYGLLLNETGVYPHVFPTVDGCDSTYFMNLYVHQAPPEFSIYGDTHVDEFELLMYSTPQNDTLQYIWSVEGGNIVTDIAENAKEIMWGPTGTGLITVTSIAGNGCILVDTLEVNIGTVGFSSLYTKNQISVYPNPANNVINIMVPDQHENMLTCEINDITGRCISKSKLVASKNSIDVNKLVAGLYQLIIFDSNKEIVQTNSIVIAH